MPYLGQKRRRKPLRPGDESLASCLTPALDQHSQRLAAPQPPSPRSPSELARPDRALIPPHKSHKNTPRLTPYTHVTSSLYASSAPLLIKPTPPYNVSTSTPFIIYVVRMNERYCVPEADPYAAGTPHGSPDSNLHQKICDLKPRTSQLRREWSLKTCTFAANF